MSDPQPLIEHVGQMLVERQRLIIRGSDDKRETQLRTMGKKTLLLNLIRSLYAEANVPLESKPHHNKMFNLYSHQQDDMCERERDTTHIEIPSKLYAFDSLKEFSPQYRINKSGKIHKNCVLWIQSVSSSTANSLLHTCREISQNQPITDLCINYFHCDPSHEVPTDVFNLSKTAESITIRKSTLPRDLMEHLISQLPECNYLKKLHIENIILYNSPSGDRIGDTVSAASSKIENQVSNWGLQLGITSQSQGFIVWEPHSVGAIITSEIRKWGDNHSLQQLIVINCLLSGDMCSFIPKFKMLTHLNLNENKLGNSGIHIAKSIKNIGLDSPLQLLYLQNCSIPSETCGEILKSLSLCRKLTHLDLGRNIIGRHAEYLVNFTKSFAIDPSLQQLHLLNCSIPEVECAEMLKCLVEFRQLTHLNLSGNKVEKAGMHVIEIMSRLGPDSSLQLLCLRDCSIPTDILEQIQKNLRNCKQLTQLDVGEHNLEHSGEYLAEFFGSKEVDPILQELYLPNCSIPEVTCTKMLKSLCEYRHLTNLNLNGNVVGNGGMHIVEIIDRLGLFSPFKSLHLRDCSIPNDILQEILKCLEKCKYLLCLDLGGHSLENAGENLVKLIKSYGLDPPLHHLYLPNCSITETTCTEMLKCLSEFTHLTHLDLSGNRVGKGGIHIAEMVERLGLDSLLQLLYLRNCSIPSDILQEILKCLKKCTKLTHLDLG